MTGWDVAKHIDRYGKILEKSSNPFSSRLQMELKHGDYIAYLSAQSSPYGNGHCLVEVRNKGELIYKAIGAYIGGELEVELNKGFKLSLLQ
jgi:hypothetical protein